MKRYLQYSRSFLILSAITILALGIAVLYFNKVEMHLWLNGTHTDAGDFFFRYYTYIGEWIPYVIVALLLFYKAGWASFLLTNILLSGGIGQIVKHIANTDRPLTYFANHAPDVQLQLVDGVSMSRFYSFPSGHTTTFFALFMTLAIVCSEAYQLSTQSNATTPKLLSTFHFPLSTLFFLLALLGGYSRIYLNQHFAEDILGGMLLGIATTILLLFLVQKLDKTKFWNWNLQQVKKK